MATNWTLVLYFHSPTAHENTAAHIQYPAILPSHPSNNIYILHGFFRLHLGVLIIRLHSYCTPQKTQLTMCTYIVIKRQQLTQGMCRLQRLGLGCTMPNQFKLDPQSKTHSRPIHESDLSGSICNW